VHPSRRPRPSTMRCWQGQRRRCASTGDDAAALLAGDDAAALLAGRRRCSAALAGACSSGRPAGEPPGTRPDWIAFYLFCQGPDCFLFFLLRTGLFSFFYSGTRLLFSALFKYLCINISIPN
jgi:hypothetical protein